MMKCSIAALVINLIFNVLAVKVMGMMGPAVVTLLITFALTFALLFFGAKEIDCSVLDFFDWKEMGIIILELLGVGLITFLLNKFGSEIIPSDYLRLIVCYLIYGGLMLALNFKRIMRCLKDINKLK